MAYTFPNDTAIHEAGHCIIAYLASDIFQIEFVTADATESKKFDANSNGGLKGRFTTKPIDFNLEDHDTVVLFALSGMAADDMNLYDGAISESLYGNRVWMMKAQSRKYSGDIEGMGYSLSIIEPRLKSTQRNYTRKTQEDLYTFFSQEPVKSCLIDLANYISNSPNKTVSGNDIELFLDKSDLRNWKMKEWKNTLKRRSKMYYKGKFLWKIWKMF